MLIINEERLLKRIHTLGAVVLTPTAAVPALPPPMRIRRGAISCPAG